MTENKILKRIFAIMLVALLTLQPLGMHISTAEESVFNMGHECEHKQNSRFDVTGQGDSVHRNPSNSRNQGNPASGKNIHNINNINNVNIINNTVDSYFNDEERGSDVIHEDYSNDEEATSEDLQDKHLNEKSDNPMDDKEKMMRMSAMSPSDYNWTSTSQSIIEGNSMKIDRVELKNIITQNNEGLLEWVLHIYNTQTKKPGLWGVKVDGVQSVEIRAGHYTTEADYRAVSKKGQYYTSDIYTYTNKMEKADNSIYVRIRMKKPDAATMSLPIEIAKLDDNGKRMKPIFAKESYVTTDLTAIREESTLKKGRLNVTISDNSNEKYTGDINLTISDSKGQSMEKSIKMTNGKASTGELNLDEGAYTLTLRPPTGYSVVGSNTQNIVVEADKLKSTGFIIKSDNEPVTQDKAWKFRVVENTPQASPISGAVVSVMVNNKPVTAITGPDGMCTLIGKFEVNNLYTVTISRLGYSDMSINEIFKENSTIEAQMIPDSNSLTIRIHEKGLNNPLTQKMDGRTISINHARSEIDISATRYSEVVNNGKAYFSGLSREGHSSYIVEKINPPKGYKLIYKESFTLEDSMIQDWILTESTAKLLLTVNPPQGHGFPDDMKVEILDSEDNRVKEPMPIENGELVIDGLEQGKSYTIVYSNVPKNWTHNGNMKRNFSISETQTTQAIVDSFGYQKPASEGADGKFVLTYKAVINSSAIPDILMSTL